MKDQHLCSYTAKSRNGVFRFPSFDLAANVKQKEGCEQGGKDVDANKVKPNAVKPKMPKRAEQKNGKNEGNGDRHDGGKGGLFDGA